MTDYRTIQQMLRTADIEFEEDDSLDNKIVTGKNRVGKGQVIFTFDDSDNLIDIETSHGMAS